MSSFTKELKYEFTGSFYRRNPIYVILEEFDYCLGSLENPIHVFTVPVGYETDLASIPWPLSLIFKPDGPWSKAAVVHDYIYTHYPEISRIVADSVFLEAMIVSGINRHLAHVFFIAVRLFQYLKNKS